MNDYDKLMFIFLIISSGYFFITEHLICKIERLKKENRLLEQDNIDLRSGFYDK